MNHAETDRTDLIKLVPRGGTSRLDIITSSYTILTLDNYTKTQTYRFHKLLKLSL